MKIFDSDVAKCFKGFFSPDGVVVASVVVPLSVSAVTVVSVAAIVVEPALQQSQL